MTTPHQTRPATDATHTFASVAFQREQARSTGEIEVGSSQIQSDAAIPDRHTDYGDGASPALHWNPVGGARSYVLLVEDPDAPKAQPFVHWLAWNIPPDVHELAGGMAQAAEPDGVTGMRQGLNGQGTTGYFGPRPPRGDRPHHYHFQVFALDRMLVLPDEASRDDVLQAMGGHVLAKGQLVATSEAPATQ